MRPARILLIVVALLAGGLAAFLATRGGDDPQPTTQTAEVSEVREPRAQVLVASRAIGLGQRIEAGDVQWQDWPEGALRSEYVTQQTAPDAENEIEGAVARYEFFAGEPIRDAKLVRSGRGYLSAVIGEGMRAVSISVSPESASGGYVTPNDRVDVVLSRSGSDYSETILANIRVLAIGPRLGEVGETGGSENPEDPQGERFSDSNVATLEVRPAQAETLLNANTAGQLALVLRSVSDFDATVADNLGQARAINVIRYGQGQAVVSNGMNALRASAADPGTTTAEAPGRPADTLYDPFETAPAPEADPARVELR